MRRPARVHGWQRCRHCGTPIVAPWSEAEAHDGPAARTVVLDLPGRTAFTIPRRTLLASHELALWLFMLLLLTAFGTSVFETEAGPNGVWRWLGPLLVLALGTGAMTFFARRWATVQHLEIGHRRLVAWRSVGSRRYRRVERTFGDDLSVEVDEGIETVSENHACVRFRTGRDGGEPVDLVLPSRMEAEWLALLAREATRPRGEGAPLRCPGCAAPTPITVEEEAAGHVNCSFCRAGFVVGTHELCWAPVRLPDVELPGATRPGPRVLSRREHTRHGEARTWQVRLGGWLHGGFAAAAISTNVLFFGAFGVGVLWIVPNVPPGDAGLVVWLLGASIMMFAIAGVAAFLVGMTLFGREEIGLDEATVWTGSRLGTLAVSPSLPMPCVGRRSLLPAGWSRSGTRIPILRIVRVEIEREMGETTLRVATPTKSLEMAWVLPTPEDHALRREIVEALALRLRALGRQGTSAPEAPADRFRATALGR